MASIASISTSGLQAAQVRLQASAHNVANLQTEDFHRQEVAQQARPDGGGVDATVKRSPAAGAALEADVVEQIGAKHAFFANAAVFRTADRMLGTLLDAQA